MIEAEKDLPRWSVLVDARVEVIFPAPSGVEAEAALIAALREGDSPSLPDWTEAYVVPGSSRLVNATTGKADRR